MRLYILLWVPLFVLFSLGGCTHPLPVTEQPLKEWLANDPVACLDYCIRSHDSLFKARQYDTLSNLYGGIFKYMPTEPSADLDTLRRRLLEIIPLYMDVLRETGQLETTVRMLDSIRYSGNSFLAEYCLYPILAFESNVSLMTDNNERTEALADHFAVLKAPSNLSTVMFCCHMVSWAYHFSSAKPRAATLMQERAVAAYRQGGTIKDAGAILARMGYFYRREGKYKRAVDLSLEAIHWYDAHPGIGVDGMIRAHADLAALYSTLGLYDKALEINAKVICFATRYDSTWLCSSYRVRSSFFVDLKQADSALYYLDKEMEVAKKISETNVWAARRDRAKFWLQTCPDSNVVALRDLTAIFTDSAGVRPGTHSSTRYWLGLALVKDGQTDRGLFMIEQACREFKEMDWDEMEEFAGKELLNIYASRNMGSKMLAFYPRYAVLLDSLGKDDKLRYAAAASIRYETGRKEQENRVLTAEVKLKERTLTYVWIVCVLLNLLLVLVGVHYWQRRRHYRRERQLHHERISRLISVHQQLNSRFELISGELEKQSHTDVIDNVRQKLNSVLLSGEDERRFRLSFAALHPHYLPTLRARCPELTKSDELLCTLIYLNQSTDEVALALGISRASVNSGRSRIRKKLELEKDESLEAYLRSIKK